MADKKQEKLQWMSFFLGSDRYAIAIAKVKELVKPPKITFLPGAAEHVLGLINLRSEVIPAIDLQRLLRIGNSTISPRSRMAVVEEGETTIALLVDKLSGIVELSAREIKPASIIESGPAAEYIQGVGEAAGKPVFVLDVGKIVLKNDYSD